LFVMTLGCRRKSVRLLIFHSSSRIWAELHERAFRRLTGVPRVVVLDNLREGVLTPDIYDPTLNPLYRDVLRHHGAVALPCRTAVPIAIWNLVRPALPGERVLPGASCRRRLLRRRFLGQPPSFWPVPPFSLLLSSSPLLWLPIGKADSNLVQTVTTLPIGSCKALEIGCGTGDNSIWLAQQHFDVVGVDTSEIAVEKATEKAAATNTSCAFVVGDILKSRIEGEPFAFAFDRGCFHAMGSDEDRTTFAKQVHQHLADDGLWLSLVGNADERRVGTGPPQRTAREIVNAVEPHFEILSLVSGYFGSDRPDPPRAWICLMKKR
jgi:SAM-dependent methyltransferase